MKIFLSYASEVHDRAESVNATLLAAGHDVFFDRDDLPPGLNYDERIRAEIEGSDLFVFLISPAALAEGHYTRTELKIARRRWPDPAGHVLPVMGAPTPFEDLPPYLGSVTVLVPEGNLAAEVLLAIGDIESPPAGSEPESGPGSVEAPDAAPQYASLKVRFSYADAGRYTVDIDRPAPASSLTAACDIDARSVEDVMQAAGSTGVDAVRRPPGALRDNALPTAAQAREAGGLLYKALFGPGLRPGLEDSLRGIDPQQGKGLRFVIDTTDTPELGRLPWEFVYSAEKDDFLFSDRMKPVVRWLDIDEPTPTLRIGPPLRVLIAYASPGGETPLRIGEELARLDEALLPLSKRGLVSVTRLEHTTLERLDEALLNTRPHVLHFIGHGDFNGGDGLLLLESDAPDGAPDPLTGRRLGVLLRNHLAHLRLVFLNSCMGARVSPVDPFGGIAQTLIRRGVPAVIAMQFAIADKAAVELSRHFYRYLAAGQPVDAALTSTRAFLFARGHEVEWGAPALHMRSPDGRLFDITATARIARPAAANTPVRADAETVAPAPIASEEAQATHAATPSPAGEPPQSPAVLTDETFPSSEVSATAAEAPSPPTGQTAGTAPARRRSGLRLIGAGIGLLLLASAGLYVATYDGSFRQDAEAPLPAPSGVPASTGTTAADAARAAADQLGRGETAAAIASLRGLLERDAQALGPAALGSLHEALAERIAMATVQSLMSGEGEQVAELQALLQRMEPFDENTRARLSTIFAAAASAATAEPGAGAETGSDGSGESTGIYTVRRGDTLSGIAARLTGESAAWPRIVERHNAAVPTMADLDPISDPDRILVGQGILVPWESDGDREGWLYHVQRGDTLWGIATRFYGDGRQWPRITPRPPAVLDDPGRILPGWMLFVPVTDQTPR